jgi:hypothetical protein
VSSRQKVVGSRGIFHTETTPFLTNEDGFASVVSNDEHFRKAYLLSALEAGLIEMTVTDKPQSSKQKYRLTAKGKDLVKRSAKPGHGGHS